MPAPVAPSAGISIFWPWFFEICKILLSSAISICATGIWLQRWQHREKYIDERISDLLKEVEATADLAVLYWERSAAPWAAKFRQSPPVHDRVRDRAQEAELVARTFRIARMRASISEYLQKSHVIDLSLQEADLFRAFTGGDFGASDRVCEPDRFDQIRGQTGGYIQVVRDARRARVEQSVWKSVRH